MSKIVTIFHIDCGKCVEMTKHITKNIPCFRAGASAMSNKSNLVLYLDKETIRKSKDLCFNLSRIFENHLKHLIVQFSQLKTEDTVDSKGIISGKWAEPELNRRPLARKANVITRLDHRPLILYITSVSLIFNFRLFY